MTPVHPLTPEQARNLISERLPKVFEFQLEKEARSKLVYWSRSRLFAAGALEDAPITAEPRKRNAALT